MTSRGVNLLSGEKSPYLLLHADNPVDWHPWGSDAFEKAKRQDKPIFLSIGYAACHWCRVMERESFCDEEVANLLNGACIPVKVDREERPDIDGAFMAVCEMLNGSGGWPLNVFLTPDGLPFFAATYLPKRSGGAIPGMVDVVPRMKWLFATQRSQVESSARSIRESLVAEEEAARSGSLPGTAAFKRTFDELAGVFDREWGGFSKAPKFSMPSHLVFLIRYWRKFGVKSAWSMVERTIERIWQGGIHDHLAGGIARYSTDRRWLLPHFEKMLNDQALMLYVLSECAGESDSALFGAFADDITGFVLGEMTSPEGGFYSAIGAESDGEEGKYYLWTEEEIRSVLSPEEAGVFICAYGIRKGGNVKNERTGRILGDNVLHIAEPAKKTAPRFGLSAAELDALLARCRGKLLAERKGRVPPLKDDKILTDWNGLMIASLARASEVFKRPEWLNAAEKAARFIDQRLRDRTGGLLHRYRDGESAVSGLLDDYAFFSWGLTELAVATGRNSYADEALKLLDAADKAFADEKRGGFFTSSGDDPFLFLRRKEAYDGASPSGNSVMTDVYIRLSALTGRRELLSMARRTASAFSGRAAKYPLAHTWLLAAATML
ncbi:MAG: thioredoxin domain-containing protein [Synergistaceae bacterium]|nr:thioredoxin domain-containing protein [Synergistota bacterium]NLM71590.1 thioredoxin domain-containing protein [Synergistaceae bacterium]